MSGLQYISGRNNKRYCSVDIGTNTVLMLIAEFDGKNFHILDEKYEIARLGENLDKTGFIGKEAFDRTIKILKSFVDIAESYNSSEFVIAATSAMREATNGDEIKNKIEALTGKKIDIITGEKEAKLSFEGTVENKKRNIVIDIGGGSTEVIYGKEDNILFLKSFDIGAVRLTERFFSEQPPTLVEIEKASDLIAEEIYDEININDFEDIYAVAGTATTIAATAQELKDFDIEKIDGYVLTSDILSDVFYKYAASETDKIIEKYGVHPKRADLITAGTLILKMISLMLNKKNIIVSAKGLRYGLLKDHIKKFDVKFIRS